MGTTTLTMLGGEPAAIRSSAAQWRSFGVTAAAASVTVAAQSAVAVGFAGGEGEQYRIRLADFAAGLDTVGDAWCQVAAALEAFAGELEACQADLRTLARSVDEPADSPGGPADDLKAGQDQDDADREAAVRQRAQQIQERHRAAVRRCCVAINLARALAPNPTGTILGLRRVVPGLTTPPTTTGTGTGRDQITAVSYRLRTAATTATQAGGLSLHRGAALSTPTDDGDLYADAPDALKPGGEVWKEIHRACVANTPDDQGSGIGTDGLCIGVANSVAADPTSLPTVMQQYSGYFLGPRHRSNSWAVVGNVFADLGGMVADITGISACLDGDAIGCTIAAAGMVIGGPLGPIGRGAAGVGKLGRAAEKATKATKATKASAKELDEAADKATAAARKAADDAVRQARAKRVEEFREKTRPTKPEHSPVPDDLLEAAAEKIPEGWIPSRGKAGKDKRGKVTIRFHEKADGSGDSIRIDVGDPKSLQPSQRVDHVVITAHGQPLDRYGGTLQHSKQAAAHIPLTEWRKWKRWDHP